ncbi:MAG: Protoporphyrinogen IX oxidase, novel form, HemJ (EC 1.3.-.-) [Olavius algarvensis Gamma 3 endosymbiont]|nr:MAG: Protoporphyrinogen IX oxidase, novel form, HemJ (EC 1.3.-.-) [Olavius algarvensis spirochete endosymbiont]CAD7849582.1 MAG: Protoporphyrinogen IX oxidase, novel form, HemJ (EC 1.3.-.-) [Olavius algarvensis Gamma 3 endosymbiont]
MIWIKAFHIIFMVAWFAGLFYLPRLFVNHAMAAEDAVRDRLKLMERKLYRFITPWMLLTLVFGFWLLFDYAWAAYSHMLWLHVKLALVAALVVYHFYCGKLVGDFANDRNRHSHVWYRWFNELPVLVLFAVVILAVVKPF